MILKENHSSRKLVMKFDPVEEVFILMLIRPGGDVDHFEGRLAVVGLPCHLKALNRICDRNLNINKKIVMKIGLFCGHNSDKKLLYKVLEKKKISIGDINAFLFRRGRWRGQMRIVLNDNKIIEFPFSHYSVYRNLNSVFLKRCH